MSTLSAQLLGLLIVCGAIASSTLAVLHLSWMAGNFAAVLVMIYGFFAAFARGRPLLILAAVYALAGGVLSGIELRDYLIGARGEIVQGVEAASLPGIEGVSGFYFRNAVVRSDLQARYMSDSVNDRTAGTHHFAAPVVDAEWSLSRPVAVWAVCLDIDRCRKAWLQPFNAALKVEQRDEDFWKAVRAAEERYALTSAPGAVLVEWVPTPETAIRQRLEAYKWTAQFWAAAWVATALAAVALNVFRRKEIS